MQPNLNQIEETNFTIEILIYLPLIEYLVIRQFRAKIFSMKFNILRNLIFKLEFFSTNI